MGLRKSLQSLGTLAGILSPVVLNFLVSLPPLSAQSFPEWQVSVTFPPMSDRGAPERTAGGGTRGEACTQNKEGEMDLTVLAPANNVGKTVAANPTFFLYIPATKAKSAEFSLQDHDDQPVYSTTVSLSNVPGVIQISLPANTPLKVGEKYVWQFALICNPQNREDDKRIYGWTERLELSPTLQAQIQQADPLEQAKLYAENQIWHEAISILAQLHHSNPSEWQELLNSVDLDAIASAPIVDCCKPQHQSAQPQEF